MPRPALPPESARTVSFANLRFTEAEYLKIQQTITQSGLTPRAWLRSRILGTTIQTPATPPKPTELPKQNFTRKSTSININSLGDFYGQNH